MTQVKVMPQEVLGFTETLLLRSGVDEKEAKIIARTFVWNDLAGRKSQGLWRLPIYLKRTELGLITSPCHAQISDLTTSVSHIDGNSGFGHYLGNLAMEKAIGLAQAQGVGLVSVSNSNHYGSGAYYVNLAARQNCIGIATSNSVPHVAAHGGKSAVLGTNPFAFSAPKQNDDPILVDFSTGAASGSSVMKAKETNAGIPDNVYAKKTEKEKPNSAQYTSEVFLPFGGAKGFGVGLMVEILSGVISGSAISDQIASLHKNFERSSNIGHFFMALDISKLMPLDLYFERIAYLIGIIKNSEPVSENMEILIPGETRWRHFREQQHNGIEYDQKTVDAVTKLATELGVQTPW